VTEQQMGSAYHKLHFHIMKGCVLDILCNIVYGMLCFVRKIVLDRVRVWDRHDSGEALSVLLCGIGLAQFISVRAVFEANIAQSSLVEGLSHFWFEQL
jgi:hypothetical protein